MHDGRKLMELMGGDQVAIDRLDQMFSLPAEVQNRLTAFGLVYRFPQWAPGNEHDLEVPWMYHFAGQPWRAAAELAEARHLYRPTIDGLPGNDDLGGLSSWHLLDMLGLGALVPGAPYFALGSPAFERAEIDTADGTFTIESPGSGPYVANASLNGEPLDRAWIYDSEMTGTLRLERSSSRTRSGAPTTGPRAAPTCRPSAAASSLAALPFRLALLAEGLHALAEVLAAEAALAQLDQVALEVGRELAGVGAQLADDALVPLERQRGVGGDLGGDREPRLLELVRLDHPVHEPHLVAAVGVDVAARRRRARSCSPTPQTSMNFRSPVWE